MGGYLSKPVKLAEKPESERDSSGAASGKEGRNIIAQFMVSFIPRDKQTGMRKNRGRKMPKIPD